MTKFIIGNMLDGKKIQVLPDVISGSWSETLNGAGSVECTVPLTDPDLLRMVLREAATPGKAFLAALDGDTVLQAGPIWVHEYDEDNNKHLKLSASGMWGYFDHRVLLPVLAGRLPTDPTTDTRFQNISVDPDWPTDTSKSYQGMVRALVAQAQAATGGNVPVVLPTEIPGENEKWWKGSELGFVGPRIYDLTQLLNGPDVKFAPRLTTDRMGIEWVLQVGTPAQPMIYGALEPVFNLSVAESSVSRLRVRSDGSGLASQGFAIAGRSQGEAIAAVATDPTLTNAGFPLLEDVDSTHSTVSEAVTIQSYADVIPARGKRPVVTISFDHDLSYHPYLSEFNVGDFTRVKYRGHAYLGDSPSAGARLRNIGRSGDAVTKTVSLQFAPEVL